ncbi:MAG: type II secretion system protein GspD, partial [Planctomycetota bacterium]
QDAGLPEQTTRKSTTEVIVEQGQTIVIGGLRQQETNNTVTKVPLLSDLPLVGGLFRNEEEEVKNSVLTIFITPQLLKPEEGEPGWIQLDPNDHKIVPIMKNKLSPTNGNHK